MTAEQDRLERVARMRQRERERNRSVGVPDLEFGDRHEPAEYFAQVGFFWVLDKIGRTEAVQDWSEDGGDERDHQQYLDARRRDHQRVADWLRDAAIGPLPNRNGCVVAGHRIMWADRVPALKVWAGQQTLAKVAGKYQKALPKEVEDVLAVQVGVKGSSGLYKPCASTALEDGFSVNALGMERLTPIGMELLAIIGLETLALTVYPDSRIGYDADGSRWVFTIEDRGDYYGRWGTAERAR